MLRPKKLQFGWGMYSAVPNKNSTILRSTWEKIQLLLDILDYYFNGFLKKFRVLFLLSTTILRDFLKNYYFNDFLKENYYFKGYFGKLLLF